MAVVIETENGILKICSTDFEVLSLLIDDERGVSYYQVRIMEPIAQTKVVPCSLGATGIVKILATAGAFVRPKELTKYIEEYLSNIWETLPIKHLHRDGELTAPNNGVVYEFFLEYLSDFAERFDTEEFGLFKQESNSKFAYVLRQAMHDFFKKLGIPPEQQVNVLRFWRDAGWLIPQRDGRHLTVVQRVGGCLRRVYKIALPPEEDSAVVGEVLFSVEAAASSHQEIYVN